MGLELNYRWPAMRIISVSRLIRFAATREGMGSLPSIQRWRKIVKPAHRQCFADVKAVFGRTVDSVGDCVIFNIGNNNWRLITPSPLPDRDCLHFEDHVAPGIRSRYVESGVRLFDALSQKVIFEKTKSLGN